MAPCRPEPTTAASSSPRCSWMATASPSSGRARATRRCSPSTSSPTGSPDPAGLRTRLARRGRQRGLPADRPCPGRFEPGSADMRALKVVAAPQRQLTRRFLVLDPFRDDLEPEMAGKVDQGAHEEAVVGGARHVLDEGPVDLDEVDAEIAQGPEGRVARAEVVDGDAGAILLHRAHEAGHHLQI